MLSFAKNSPYKFSPWVELLELEGTGGAAIPYLRFVEVNLQDSRDKKIQQRMCCCWLSPPCNLLQDSSSHGGYKDNQQSPESHDYEGACKGYHNMETGPLLGQSCWGSLQLSCSSPGKCKMTAGATSSFQQGGTGGGTEVLTK